MPLLLLNEDELRQIVTINEAIEAVEASFVALAEGRLDLPGDFTLSLPKAQGKSQIRGTHLRENPYYVVNVRNDFQKNPASNLPIHSALTAVFDAATGSPIAIMIDNGYLSSLRAAAAGALAAKYLANPQLDQVTVIGSGDQAYMQLKALMMIRRIGAVRVWAHSPASADNYARRMVEDHDVRIQITTSVEEAVKSADLIIMGAEYQHPLLKSGWLKAGVHITTLSDDELTPHKLDADVLKRADVIITDAMSRALPKGEIHHALEAGTISQEEIQGTLSDLIIGKIPGRTDTTQITLADLTGLDLQDSAVATLAVEKALFLGLGQQVESQL